MIKKLRLINVGIRGVMEIGVIAGLGYWGYALGETVGTKILLAILIPLIGFGFWGAVDFHQAGKTSELLRLVQELLISGLAAVGFYAAGQHVSCLILAFVSIIHHALIYFIGDRLIKNQKRDNGS